MKRVVLLIAALIILLGIPTIVWAEKPEGAGNLWEAIGGLAEKIEGLKQGVDFDVPDDGTWKAYVCSDKLTIRSEGRCLWHGIKLGDARARAIISLPDGEEDYAVNGCSEFVIDVNEKPNKITIDIWFWWTGKEIHRRLEGLSVGDCPS